MKYQHFHNVATRIMYYESFFYVFHFLSDSLILLSIFFFLFFTMTSFTSTINWGYLLSPTVLKVILNAGLLDFTCFIDVCFLSRLTAHEAKKPQKDVLWGECSLYFSARYSDWSQSLSLVLPPWNLISCCSHHAPSSGYATDLIFQQLDWFTLLQLLFGMLLC